MPLGGSRVFLEETCLVARPALPFATLKRRLERRCAALGIKARSPAAGCCGWRAAWEPRRAACLGCRLLPRLRGGRAGHAAEAGQEAAPRILKPARTHHPLPQVKEVHEEEWSYIPVGGPLPLPDQPAAAFGAAASLVHPGERRAGWVLQAAGFLADSLVGCWQPPLPPLLRGRQSPACATRRSLPLPTTRPSSPAATGYSITRSLREAPAFARACRLALEEQPSSAAAVRFVWEALWTQERRRQVRGGRACDGQAGGGGRVLGHAAIGVILHPSGLRCCPPTPAAACSPFRICLRRRPREQASFQVFGMELLCQLDTAATADFFTTFFRLPASYWRGFLASKLSSGGCSVGVAGVAVGCC